MEIEQHYCVQVEGGPDAGDARVVVVGLDSGVLCPGPQVDVLPRSLGWVGDFIYYCDESHGEGLGQIDARTGTMRRALGRCERVATDERGALIIHRGSNKPLVRFADFNSLVAGEGAELGQIPDRPFAVAGDRVFSVGQSYDRIEVYDLRSGARVDSIELQGQDIDDSADNIEALAIIDRELVILPSGGQLEFFDSRTGRKLDEHQRVRRSGPVMGLSCR